VFSLPLLLPLLCCAERLVTGSNALCVWDINTTQLLYTLDPPASTSGSPGLSSSSSCASLAASAAAATTAAAAAAAAGEADLDDDEDLLQNGWLLQDDDSESDLSEDEDGPGLMVAGLQQQSAAAVAGAGGSRAGSMPVVAPWTSISCKENLLAAGKLACFEAPHAVHFWHISRWKALRQADTVETVADSQAPDLTPCVCTPCVHLLWLL
jgi:hypothetical protein